VRKARGLHELARIIERARARFSRNETLARFVEDAALEQAEALGWSCPKRAHEGRAAHTERCADALLAKFNPEQLRLFSERRKSVRALKRRRTRS
jgi:hypothetical protein